MATDPAMPAALVEGVDEDSDTAVDLERWVGLARSVVDGFRFARPAELGLHFVTEDRMAELNREHMGQQGPTDVLSFPVDGHPGVLPTPSEGDAAAAVAGAGEELPIVLGDVILCAPVAARGAAARGVAIDDEIALLVVHGILHLLEWDHADQAETDAMQAEERRLLDLHHVATS